MLAFERNERIPIWNTLMAIVITAILLLGSAGAIVYAAQSSLPNETLYLVKLWSEDVRLVLTNSLQGQLDLTLDFTNRRMTEIAALQANGKPVPGEGDTRLLNELDAVLYMAAGMDDSRMVPVLEQIRLQAENQSRIMTTLMDSGAGQDNPGLVRLQERLLEQVRLAAAGEADPQGFRLQMRSRQNRPSQEPNTIQPGILDRTPGATPVPAGNTYGPGPGGSSETGTPGYYGQGGPNASQTPMPTGGGNSPATSAGQQTSTPGGHGPGTQNPSITPQSGGSGTAQATAKPQQGGNPENSQPATPPWSWRGP